MLASCELLAATSPGLGLDLGSPALPLTPTWQTGSSPLVPTPGISPAQSHLQPVRCCEEWGQRSVILWAGDHGPGPVWSLVEGVLSFEEIIRSYLIWLQPWSLGNTSRVMLLLFRNVYQRVGQCWSLPYFRRVLSLSMVVPGVFTNIYLLQIKGITLGPTPLAGLIFIL